MAVDERTDMIVGCGGVGSLHGLPLSEAVGEIRDLVVESKYRGLGIGGALLRNCLTFAKTSGYRRMYLETSERMHLARKLFIRMGFRPVVEKTLDTPNRSGAQGRVPPCYFILEELQNRESERPSPSLF